MGGWWAGPLAVRWCSGADFADLNASVCAAAEEMKEEKKEEEEEEEDEVGGAVQHGWSCSTALSEHTHSLWHRLCGWYHVKLAVLVRQAVSSIRHSLSLYQPQ